MKTNTFKSLALFGVIALTFASCAEVPGGIKRGCTDPAAANYDVDAAEDDGGCVVIKEKQYSLFFKYTATWCPPCGSQGGPNFMSIVDNNPGQILAFSIQTNDDFETPVNDAIFTAFSTRWPYGGTPNYQCNEVALGVNHSPANTEIATHNALAPEAGIGLHYTVGAGPNTGKLNINAYVKFFKPASGEYFAGIYILHKSIIKTQNVDGTPDPNYEHHHVMMANVTDIFGDPIASGQIGAGKVYNLGYVFPYSNIPDLNLTKYEVVGILFKKNGTTYNVVNVTPNV